MRRLSRFTLTIAATFLSATIASAAGDFVAGFFNSAIPARAAGAIRYGEGWALPLKGGAPLQWYTSAVSEQVRRAGLIGQAVRAPAEAPVPAEAGVRPGTWMVEPRVCTLGYVFQKDGELAMATAGHCVDEVGQHVIALTRVPGTQETVLVDIGEVIERHDQGVGNDYALVALRPAVRPWVQAAAAVVGGPCGAFDQSGSQTAVFYGYGAALRGAQPEAGPATRWRSDSFGWDAPVASGDSGAPVRLTDFSAAGLLTHLIVDADGQRGFAAGTRISRILEQSPGWQLKRSPFCV